MQKTIFLLSLLSLTLSACGRMGPPEPPGPPDQIAYPQAYPSE